MLRLHVRELRHFVGLVHNHFVAGVCEGCWAELLDTLDQARSPVHVRHAHETFVSAATKHCLLHPDGQTAASLLTAVLALALSLHREVGEADAAAEASDDADAAGASWAMLVEASRRQFALLLASLARQPLAPPELVHESVVGGLDLDLDAATTYRL